MNLADSMQSQDNINKVVPQGREKCNSLLVDRMTGISVRKYDQQITGKNRSM